MGKIIEDVLWFTKSGALSKAYSLIQRNKRNQDYTRTKREIFSFSLSLNTDI